jgi:acetyl-CoA acetyltransferase
MSKDVYVAGVGLTKVDLTGSIFASAFELFAEAYRRALEDSSVRAFDAIQVGIMDSEEFENRANIATKVADVLGLKGIPAVRSETASSTGAAAFHEAYYKVASGEFDSVLVLAGERMKTVTTEVATAIMSKTIAPVERRFGFTMPALIALVTQAWFRERKLKPEAVSEVLARLMHRAHAFGSQNPLAAFHGKPEPVAAYYDEKRNLPVATPLMRKDCSPICDGAAALILTSKPQAVRVAGLGSATETSSLLDRRKLSSLEATRRAADVAYWRAGIRDPRALEGLVVECHDAFNSLLPLNLGDLRLLDPDEAVEALVGRLKEPPGDPFANPRTGVDGVLPTNLSGGLKARGHPVGGTGLFQIAETYLQMTERFPNPAAQVAGARIGLSHSIGGPGNNVYVTIIERADGKRAHESPPKPRLHWASRSRSPGLSENESAHDASAVVEAYTTIHVTTGDSPGPIHVALVRLGERRVFAKLDHAPEEGEPPEAVLAGQRIRLLVKDDGDHYFQIPRGRGLGIGGLMERVRRRVVGSESEADDEPAG